MSHARTLIVCPGRGSYTRTSLGTLKDRPAAAEVVAACDAWRAARGLPTVTELDAADRFRGTLHVAGEHASLLTFACSMADLAELDRDRHAIVGVVGNSMGWYTALAAAGALSLTDAIRLVDTMGSYQAGNVVGGQLLYPTADEDWRPDEALERAVEDAIAATRADGGQAWWSIRLGGFAVLAGDTAGLAALQRHLPPVQRGDRAFPNQLPLHSAFHTPLLGEASERGQRDLADLAFGAPRIDLIDGRGRVHPPLCADPADLRAWTLRDQVVHTYDFELAVRTALHHTAPDRVVLLGPGNPLGGPVARILVHDHWRGVRTRPELEAQQASDPVLLSFGVPTQRALLV